MSVFIEVHRKLTNSSGIGVVDGVRTRYLRSDSPVCLPLPLQPHIRFLGSESSLSRE